MARTGDHSVINLKRKLMASERKILIRKSVLNFKTLNLISFPLLCSFKILEYIHLL